MDYRIAILNMSNQFQNLRFGQFIINACMGQDPFYMTDEELYEKCKLYASIERTSLRVFYL